MTHFLSDLTLYSSYKCVQLLAGMKSEGSWSLGMLRDTQRRRNRHANAE